MRGRDVLLGVLVMVLIGIALFIPLAWYSALPTVDREAPSSFDRATVAHGAQLAALGDCYECHTADGGQAFAGGRALKTPFGTIHGTNITPDPETGIGGWSETAFMRAMREGVDREGRHLYPAFPYDHFNRMTDADLHALYAFLMTREPVRAETPPNDLPFPFNIRMLIAGWKLLYFDKQRFQPDHAQSEQWNRGAYLVHGPSHCGACHTPRNFLGGEKRDHFLAGGVAEGWRAPALDRGSPAAVPWTAEALFRYLATGRDFRHSVPAGPMAPVVHHLAGAPESDVQAIAHYIASVGGEPSAERRASGQQVIARVERDRERFAMPGGQAREGASAPAAGAPDGAAIYAGACAACHDSAAQTPASSDAMHLALSSAVRLSTPRNLVRIILDGIIPREGESGPWMPGFAGAFTDEQLNALIVHLRERFGPGRPWDNLRDEIAAVRKERRGS
jgi:mono/diheme cytochrome c family protein